MAVVVRCPGCRGAARVGPEAVGLLVVCPRCSDPFMAVEEAPSELPAEVERRPARRPRAEKPRRSRSWAEPVAPPPADTPPPGPADPHDALPAHSLTLPVSVLVGLALLPFTIPLLWLLGPHVAGHQPALTVATPAALAVAAAALCLAVVFTVDWTPATRVKGVLMLVGLAYFAGLSLFFLKKDMVDRAQKFFGPEHQFRDFTAPGGEYRVKLPKHPRPAPGEQPLPGWTLACARAEYRTALGGTVTFVVGVGPDAHGGRRWNAGQGFADVEQALARRGGGTLEGGRELNWQGHPGREWEVTFQDRNTVRVVRVIRANGRVYYLSAEGDDLEPDGELVQLFFTSLQVTAPKK